MSTSRTISGVEPKFTIMEKYVMPLLVGLFTFFTPCFYWFGAIGFFMVADLVLRSIIILKACPEEWVSGKLWRTAYKFGVGCVFILVAYMCQKMFVPDIPVMKIIGSYLILIELKSIDEKAKESTGLSLFSLVIERLDPKKKG